MGSTPRILRDRILHAAVLITMRNRSPKSFTVEIKSSGRNQRTIIPHRAVAPAALQQAVSYPPRTKPELPVAEPRRILPSLIVSEALPEELQPAPASAERSAQPRRGRPRKVKPIVAEADAEPIAERIIEFAPAEPAQALRTPHTPMMRATASPVVLPLGERWKRRLGRWAR